MGERPDVNILIATGLYPPDIGGPATHARFIETVLPERGFVVTVVPFGPVRHYPKLVRHAVFAWRLWRQAKTADIIYALDPVSVGVPAYLVSKLRRKPFVLRLGGDYAWEQGRQRFRLTETLDEYTAAPTAAPLPVRLLATLQRAITRKAMTVIAPSQYLASVVQTWGVQPDRLKIVYSVLYPLPVSVNKDAARAQFGVSGTVIVTAGRLVPWKGMSALIEVVSTLRMKFPDIQLLIVGDGPERVALEAQVRENELTDMVRFTGALDKATLGVAKRAADIFVLNTAYEGLSHELLEVMDLEVPIVSTTAGGNPELITDKVSGRLVAFNDQGALVDAIAEIITNASLAQNFTHAAKQRTTDFEHGKVVEQIAAVFRSIL